MNLGSVLRLARDLVFGDPVAREALRLENELRDELEANIARLGGLFSNDQGMRLAGLAITAGKVRAQTRGIPLRLAALGLIDDLTIALGSLGAAWKRIGQLDSRGFHYVDSPAPKLSACHRLTVIIDDMNSTWSITPR